LADFNTLKLKNFPGRLIARYHPDVFTYVSPSELPQETKDSNMLIGLGGETSETETHASERRPRRCRRY